MTSKTKLSAAIAVVFAASLSAGAVAYSAPSGQTFHANGTPALLDVSAFGKWSYSPMTWEARARAVIAANADKFGLTDVDAELDLLRVESDIAGNMHVHFAQRHQGIRVEGARLSAHFDRRGAAKTLTGLVHPTLGVATDPAIAEEDAVAAALETVREATSAKLLRASETELVIYDIGAAAGDDGEDRLAFKVTVVGDGVREFAFVDAVDGGILAVFTGIMDGRNRLTYDAHNRFFKFFATLEREENTPPVGDTDVDNAHDYAGDTYDWFFNAYGRDSIDGAGMSLVSYTHYRRNYLNAFWDGRSMTYGEGMPVDDVAAHEMTHGVTERTANLVYANQSGALNEGFSDIFGEAVDQLNLSGDDSPAAQWLLGEDLPSSIGVIRDMADPPVYDQPDRVGSPFYYCGTQDNGGVHINSGVPNKLFYLLTDGDSFNGETVSALGLIKSAAIHYQALTQYHSPNSTMLDHYNFLLEACDDLIGANLLSPLTGAPSGDVINAGDCDQVRKAGDAVELTAPVCG